MTYCLQCLKPNDRSPDVVAAHRRLGMGDPSPLCRSCRAKNNAAALVALHGGDKKATLRDLDRYHCLA